MNRKSVIFFSVFATLLFTVEPTTAKSQSECGPMYAVRIHDHEVLKELESLSCWVGPHDRKQIVSLKAEVQWSDLSESARNALVPFEPEMLTGYTPGRSVTLADPHILSLTSQITSASFSSSLQKVLSFGRRQSAVEKKKFMDWAQSHLTSLGYQVTADYNIIAEQSGTDGSGEMVIVIGHFDTVNTVGADDNASGAAGVLELARVLSKKQNAKNLIFILSNDEEIGLKGAYDFVKKMTTKGLKDKIKFVINMDMIAYNKNGTIDLETAKSMKPLAEWMAQQVTTYTTLTPKIVLAPWGSDHIPFIDAGVDTILTIENWDTHTPCWHKTCDTVDTVNAEYAAQLLRLNVAALAQKGGVRTR